MGFASMVYPPGAGAVGLEVADRPRRSVEYAREPDFGYAGELAYLASRVPCADDEQTLPRQVDLPLQVSQQGSLGYRIGNQVGRQPVRVRPVEQQDRRTERLRVS